MSDTLSVQWKRTSVEAAAIVVSILLAFWIDAWWNDRQESLEKTIMVATLQEDFARSREDLLTQIASVEARMADCANLLDHWDDSETSVEDLRRSFSNVLLVGGFRPSLTTYNSGVATGKLYMLNDPGLEKAFTEFLEGWQDYSLAREINMQTYFRGGVWEVRRSIGEIDILYRDPSELPTRYRLSESEYRELLGRTDVYAMVDTMSDESYNMRDGLQTMEAAATTILAALEKH
jgi:hypothetical protein